MFSAFSSYGQTIPKDEETGKFKYQKVVQAEGLTQAEIYERAKNWVLRTLKSGDNIIDLDDDKNESINATGNILLKDQTNIYTKNVLNFKFNVYVKEGRFKVIVENFTLHYVLLNSESRITALEEGYKKEGFFNGSKKTQKMYLDVDDNVKKMLADIEKAVKSGGLEEDADDW